MWKGTEWWEGTKSLVLPEDGMLLETLLLPKVLPTRTRLCQGPACLCNKGATFQGPVTGRIWNHRSERLRGGLTGRTTCTTRKPDVSERRLGPLQRSRLSTWDCRAITQISLW